MPFDLEQARKDGHSDAEIAEYLAKASGYDLDRARSDGVPDSASAEFLSKLELPPPGRGAVKALFSAMLPGANRSASAALSGLAKAGSAYYRVSPVRAVARLLGGQKGLEKLDWTADELARLGEALQEQAKEAGQEMEQVSSAYKRRGQRAASLAYGVGSALPAILPAGLAVATPGAQGVAVPLIFGTQGALEGFGEGESLPESVSLAALRGGLNAAVAKFLPAPKGNLLSRWVGHPLKIGALGAGAAVTEDVARRALPGAKEGYGDLGEEALRAWMTAKQGFQDWLAFDAGMRLLGLPLKAMGSYGKLPPIEEGKPLASKIPEEYAGPTERDVPPQWVDFQDLQYPEGAGEAFRNMRAPAPRRQAGPAHLTTPPMDLFPGAPSPEEVIRGYRELPPIAEEPNIKRGLPPQVEARKRLDLRAAVEAANLDADALRSMLFVDKNLGVRTRAAYDLLNSQKAFDGMAHVYFDGKGIKAVNDTYGHDVGDAVISDIAKIVKNHFGEENTYRANPSGDEFIGIHPDAAEAERLAAAVRDEVARRVVTVETPDGKKRIPLGGVRFGIGSDLKSADLAANAERKRALEEKAVAPEGEPGIQETEAAPPPDSEAQGGPKPESGPEGASHGREEAGITGAESATGEPAAGAQPLRPSPRGNPPGVPQESPGPGEGPGSGASRRGGPAAGAQPLRPSPRGNPPGVPQESPGPGEGPGSGASLREGPVEEGKIQGQVRPQNEVALGPEPAEKSVRGAPPAVVKPPDSWTGGRDSSSMAISPGVKQALDLLQKFASSGTGKEIIDKNLVDPIRSAASVTKKGVNALLNYLNPPRGVDKGVFDALDIMRNRTVLALKAFENLLGEEEKRLEGYNRADLVDFVDRLMRGEKQKTPELQVVADTIRQMDDSLGRAKKELFPNLPLLENHFRILYKKLPGAKFESEKPNEASSRTRRPLLGSMGSLKKRHYEALSEALHDGAEPISYNPVTLFREAFADDIKLITAGRMWRALDNFKDLKIWVERGAPKPDGYVRVRDKISMFDKPEGAPPGSWYVEEGAGRLLNNYIGNAFVRQLPLYKWLLALKDATTMIELVSGFHFMFETGESLSSDLARSIRAFVNLGDVRRASRAIGEFFNPAHHYKTGKILDGMFNAILKGNDAYLEFVKANPEAQRILKRYPGVEGHLVLLGESGLIGSWRGDPQAWRNAVRRSLSQKDYLGAIPKATLAAIEAINEPLFEHYIPALKLSVAMEELHLSLLEHRDAIFSGEMSPHELARNVVRFVEDRFGEMNWDNLWLEPNFRSLMRLALRSATWKWGNIRSMLGAIPEQARELKLAVEQGRRPVLKQKAAWLMAMTAFTGALGYAVQMALTGRPPQTPKDFVFPQIDPEDDTVRLNLWTYWKDIFHAYHAPANYMFAGISSIFGRMIDIIRNRNYFGEQIHSPESPWYDVARPDQRLKDLAHLVPTPFATQSFRRFRAMGIPAPLAAAISVGGATLAPKDVSLTPAEQKIRQFVAAQKPVGGLPESQVARMKAASQLRAAIRWGDKARLEEAMRAAMPLLGPVGIRREFERAATQDALAASASQLSPEELIEVLRVANEDEKKRLLPIALRSVLNAVKQSPQKATLIPELVKVAGKGQTEDTPSPVQQKGAAPTWLMQ